MLQKNIHTISVLGRFQLLKREVHLRIQELSNNSEIENPQTKSHAKIFRI